MKGKCDKDKNQVCQCPALLQSERAEYKRWKLIIGINPYHLETPRPDQYPRMWENVRFVWISEIVEGV
jgi:hypothetical protein